MTEIYTVPEIAAMLRMCIASVQRWCASGKLPAFKVGKCYRIEKEDFEAWYRALKAAQK
mgnify:CR=1 FL=1